MKSIVKEKVMTGEILLLSRAFVFLSLLLDFSYFATYTCQICNNRHFSLKVRLIENQPLTDTVKIFLKKSPKFVWSVIEKCLPLHPQSRGTPLEMLERKSSLKIFSIQTSSTRSDLVMSSQDRVIERTVKLISF